MEINSLDPKEIKKEMENEKKLKGIRSNISAIEKAERIEEREKYESRIRRQEAEKLDFAMRTAADRDSKRLENEEKKRIEQEKIEERNSAQKRNSAVVAAYKRYKQHNALYRVFHKSIYKMDYKNMSIEEIDNLYGGKIK